MKDYLKEKIGLSKVFLSFLLIILSSLIAWLFNNIYIFLEKDYSSLVLFKISNSIISIIFTAIAIIYTVKKIKLLLKILKEEK